MDTLQVLSVVQSSGQAGVCVCVCPTDPTCMVGHPDGGEVTEYFFLEIT